MDYKIINKHCFVRKRQKLYCSKCGEPVLQDRWNCMRHARMDHFEEWDILEPLRENEDFGYAFIPYKDKVGFVVYTPQLVPTGFNEFYKGAKWVEVYKAILDVNEKKVIEKKGGLRDIDYWKNQKMVCLNAGSVYENIYHLFHVPGMSSLGTFFDVLRHRGLRYQQVLSDKKARTILEEELPPYVEKKAKIYCTWTDAGTIYGKAVDVNGTTLLRLDVWRRKTDERIQMLVGENYFFSDQHVDVISLLQEQFKHEILEEDLQAFASANPGIGLMNYWEQSQKNILIPLLAPMFDEGLELLCKGGCTVIADAFYTCKGLRERTRSSDVKKWLGAPMKVLRRIQPDCLQDKEIFHKISQLYRAMPEFFETGDITYGFIQFLMENELAIREDRFGRIEGYQEIHPKVRRRMAKYLQERCGFRHRSYRMYVDYLNLSRHATFEGYTPQYLEGAHNRAMLANRNPLNVSEENFKRQVESEWYRSLESEYPKEAALFEEDKYFIRGPFSMYEMKCEGECLHHCVFGYCRGVANGSTRIYFLRRKSAPDLPYATIEVRENRVLQLKCKCNKRADLNTQSFVKKWARVKGISVEHTDFDF